MRIGKVRLFAISAVTIVLVSEASAQKLAAPEGFGVGGMVGFVSFSEEIDSRDPGIGFEGAVRYTSSYGFQVVGGVSYSIVDVEAADNDSQVLGFFLDPRLVLRMGMTGVAPFIGARVAYVDQSLDSDAGDASADGILIAGMVGLLFPLSPQSRWRRRCSSGRRTWVIRRSMEQRFPIARSAEPRAA